MLLFIFSILIGVVRGQLYNGTVLSVTNGAQVSVVNASLENATNGNLTNAGQIVVDRDVTNNGLIDGAGTNTGLFEVGENWYNNATFTADNSVVSLFGGDQLIGGSVITTFYDLRLDGSGVKLQAIDSKTSFLDLTSNELATDQYVMEILSPNPTAITRTSGFVSSLNNGHLQRNTNSTGPYLFPTGSSLGGTTLYRPIEIAPTDGSSNIYGVRLANNLADIDGYPLQNKEPNIKKLNPNYYHHLYNLSRSNRADITFFYNASADGNYQNIGHWNTSSLWSSFFNEIQGQNGLFSTLTINDVNNFDSRAFILARTQDEIYIQNAFTPNGDYVNDEFSLMLNPEDFEEFTFQIFNRWGQLIVETDNPKFIWDGTYKGELSPMGVYPWRLTYRQSSDPEIQTKTGHISLIK